MLDKGSQEMIVYRFVATAQQKFGEFMKAGWRCEAIVLTNAE